MNDTIKYISDVIEKISGVRNIDKNINLLGPKSKIESYLFIYIFSEFEENTGKKYMIYLKIMIIRFLQ